MSVTSDGTCSMEENLDMHINLSKKELEGMGSFATPWSEINDKIHLNETD
jgi:hypothetical protein